LTAADLSKLSTIVGWVLLQVARAHPRGFLRKLRVVVGGGGGPKMDVWQLRLAATAAGRLVVVVVVRVYRFFF